MTKGQTPVEVVRKENLALTVWDNPKKKPEDGTWRQVKLTQSYATKETKNLPKEQREYKHKDVSLGVRQIKVLKEMLEELETKLKTGEEKEDE